MIWHVLEVWLLMLAAFAIGAPLGALAYDLIARTELAETQEHIADGIGNVVDAIKVRLGIGPVWRPEHRRIVEDEVDEPRVPFAPWRDDGVLDEDEDVDAIEAGAEPLFDDDIEPMRPMTLAGPRNGAADDLQRIYGVGARNERRLNALGIFHYGQIAAWTPAEMRWIALRMAFPERVEADDWVGQAITLATGGDTGYAKAKRRNLRPGSYDDDDYEDDEGTLMLPDAAIGFAIGSDAERLAAAVSDIAERDRRAAEAEAGEGDDGDEAPPTAEDEAIDIVARETESSGAETPDEIAMVGDDQGSPPEDALASEDKEISASVDDESDADTLEDALSTVEAVTAPPEVADSEIEDEAQDQVAEPAAGAEMASENAVAREDRADIVPDVAEESEEAVVVAEPADEPVAIAEDVAERLAVEEPRRAPKSAGLSLPDASLGFSVAPARPEEEGPANELADEELVPDETDNAALEADSLSYDGEEMLAAIEKADIGAADPDEPGKADNSPNGEGADPVNERSGEQETQAVAPADGEVGAQVADATADVVAEAAPAEEPAVLKQAVTADEATEEQEASTNDGTPDDASDSAGDAETEPERDDDAAARKNVEAT